MKWVVTAEEMRRIDSRAIEKIGIPASTLMERAGLVVADKCLSLIEDTCISTAAIFCGKGNNGGDGLVAARELHRRGVGVSVYICANPDELQGLTAQNYSIAKNINVPITYITSPAQLKQISESADIIVDALLGTGIRGEVTGLNRDVIKKINEMSGTVVAVDLPSGVNADTGNYSGDCVRADVTITMGLLKRGLLLHPGKLNAGQVQIADIGFPETAVTPEKVKTFLIEQADICGFLPERLPFCNKTNCGRVLIIGGSPGLTGAPSMTATAAFRSGAGMVLLGISRSLNPIVEVKLTETMTLPLPETEEGSLGLDAEKPILNALDWADVLAIGPGLGRNKQTIKLVHSLIEHTDLPIVIDADGLFALAQKPNILKKLNYNTVITPHDGEFSRFLTEKEREYFTADRIESVRNFAQKYRTTILLKGNPTLVCGKSGEVFINPTGNAGMATAGAGDVLTGIITALIGQGMNLTEAAVSGAYIHGYSGDLAKEEVGEISLMAGDLIDFLPYAFEDILGHVENQKDHQEE